jgi:hypothetical protein
LIEKVRRTLGFDERRNLPTPTQGAVVRGERDQVVLNRDFAVPADDGRSDPRASGPASAPVVPALPLPRELALSQCAVVAQRYARDLEEAQDDARDAIEDAREAQRRIDRAQAQLTDARDAGAAAALREAGATAQVLVSGLTGTPDAGAAADLDAARADADAAAAREAGAQRDLEAAQEDLRAAKKRGERAEQAAEDAARAAAGAFQGLASASPAAVYAGQVAQAREAARVKAEADDDGGALDDAWNWASGAAGDVGNTASGFTKELSFGVVDLGGDKDSAAYKTGQVGSYVPWKPASARKSLGTGAVKVGVKAFGKEAVKEGAETAAKRNLDEAARRAPGRTPNQYWTKRTDFQGHRVHQRDDLIDPGAVDPKGRTNVDRMERGLAPIGPDGKSLNLHHTTQRNDGALAEVSQTFHQQNARTLHINPNSTPSGIDRAAFEAFRRDYWAARARDFARTP